MDTLLHTTFLSENPASFGQLSDARPVVTRDFAIAAGANAAGGAGTLLFTVEAPGTLGLLQEVYGGIITPTEDHIRLLRNTFGESDGEQDHPVGRYGAVLAQCVAQDILSSQAAHTMSGELMAGILGRRISDALDDLRVRMNELLTETELPSETFTVSFAACRVRTSAADGYAVEIFSAGDHGFYVLDEWGLSPLWLVPTAPLSPAKTDGLMMQRIEWKQSTPLAVVILSGGLAGMTERVLTDMPGRIWRERMRTEEQLLRAVTMAAIEEEFGDRCAYAYTGLAEDRDCVTGAILYRHPSYEDFYAMCHHRLHALEDLVALLPDGYDASQTVEQPPLEAVEEAFIRYAFTARPALLQSTMDRLGDLVMQLLRHGEPDPSPASMALETGGSIGLTHARVQEIFDHYDAENIDDRYQVEANRRIMHDLLSDHWITLRPILCPEEACDETDPDYAAACDRAYASCRDMNAHLTALLNQRQKGLTDLEALLSESLHILRASGEDWLHGRGGDDNAAAWMDRLTADFPTAMAVLADSWRAGSEACRRLQAAYAAEREVLFHRDIDPERGIWRSTYEAVQNGRLPRGSWNLYAERCTEEADDTAHEGYTELLLVLRTVSEGTRVLLDRMEGRAVERRTAHHIGGDEAWQTACLRGVLRRDPAWQSCDAVVTDEALRNEYEAAVRRWEETRNLIRRRETAFEGYRDMYTAYLPLQQI